jgi:hypothetical protein
MRNPLNSQVGHEDFGIGTETFYGKLAKNFSKIGLCLGMVAIIKSQANSGNLPGAQQQSPDSEEVTSVYDPENGVAQSSRVIEGIIRHMVEASCDGTTLHVLVQMSPVDNRSPNASEEQSISEYPYVYQNAPECQSGVLSEDVGISLVQGFITAS